MNKRGIIEALEWQIERAEAAVEILDELGLDSIAADVEGCIEYWQDMLDEELCDGTEDDD